MQVSALRQTEPFVAVGERCRLAGGFEATAAVPRQQLVAGVDDLEAKPGGPEAGGDAFGVAQQLSADTGALTGRIHGEQPEGRHRVPRNVAQGAAGDERSGGRGDQDAYPLVVDQPGEHGGVGPLASEDGRLGGPPRLVGIAVGGVHEPFEGGEVRRGGLAEGEFGHPGIVARHSGRGGAVGGPGGGWTRRQRCGSLGDHAPTAAGVVVTTIRRNGTIVRPLTAFPRRSRVVTGALAVVAVLLAGVVGGCAGGGGRDARGTGAAGDAGSGGMTTTTAGGRGGGGPAAFVTYEEPWVDTTRPTEPLVFDAVPSAGRSLPTTIRVPVGTDAHPVVVFSHGLGSSPQRFSQLLDAWAVAGYVVAAPRFPLTSDANPDHDLEVDDQVNLPADVSFVIDQVLAASQTPGDPLEGRVDPGAIGAAGFSLGGGATYALVFNDTYRDPRIRSAAILASAVLFDAQSVDLSASFPLLIVHSTTDEQLDYEFARNAFSLAGGPAWFVTLDGFAHHDPFDDAPTPVDDAVEALTTAFWDLTLADGGDAAGSRLADAVASAGGLAQLETRGR